MRIPWFKKKITGYEEYEYWNSRPHPNDTSQPMETMYKHIEYMRDKLSDAEKILDFGPGIGRTFAAYGPGHIIEGCDISTKYRKSVKKKSAALGLDFNFRHLKMNDLIMLPYKERYFDAAVASQVLLHTKPEKIIGIMEELCRVASKVIVVSLMDSSAAYDVPGSTDYDRNKHIFNYNYPQICLSKGWPYSGEERWAEDQVMFCYKAARGK